MTWEVDKKKLKALYKKLGAANVNKALAYQFENIGVNAVAVARNDGNHKDRTGIPAFFHLLLGIQRWQGFQRRRLQDIQSESKDKERTKIGTHGMLLLNFVISCMPSTKSLLNKFLLM